MDDAAGASSANERAMLLQRLATLDEWIATVRTYEQWRGWIGQARAIRNLVDPAGELPGIPIDQLEVALDRAVEPPAVPPPTASRLTDEGPRWRTSPATSRPMGRSARPPLPPEQRPLPKEVLAELERGARYIGDELRHAVLSAGGNTVTVEEHRRIEVVLRNVVEVVDSTKDAELASTLQAAIDTIRAQVASSRPDRTIIGRSLRSIATFAGGLLVGTAGNFLTDLLKSFHQVPWPGR